MFSSPFLQFFPPFLSQDAAVRRIFGDTPTSAATNGESSAFVPTTGTAPVPDLFSRLPFGHTATSNTAFGSNVPAASRPSIFDNQRNVASTASATSANSNSTIFSNPRPGWTFTKAGSQWSEAEKVARNFNSGSIFESITKGQAANIEYLPEDLIKHAKIYIIAEKYDIQTLKNFAGRRYSCTLCTCWNSSFFVKSIELVFDSTPDISGGDSLRNTIMEAASIHAGELLDRTDFLQLCQERGDIATAILQARVKLSVSSGNDTVMS
ncbi:hypothetical protein DSL72_002209 [Monilinia vaccinii-corymbosi]|uniref:Uncharacterized protein n=1 Tax=Monilinia vaccinii-corymbosi TaxID=61207 RepID=A0A8A3PBZ4_9HELO|nr:hypothetical protein DSL72_002209 [Monilinia vaccinii-corymbosi]